MAPENTLLAFEQAVDRFSTDMLELDLRLTADGVLVVAHDASVERCTNGVARLADLSLDEVKQLDAGYRFSQDDSQSSPFRNHGIRIPTFVELVERFPNSKFNIELKDALPEAVDAFVAFMTQRPALFSLVCVGSEDDRIAAELVRRLPDACLFFPREAATKTVLALKTDGVVPFAPYHVLDLPYRLGDTVIVDRHLVDQAHERGLWVNAWTINERADMLALIDAGVDGIMTDRPDVLRQVLDDSAVAS